MEAKKYLKRKEKARQDGNREQLAISCNNLGDYYNQEGNYKSAVKEYLNEAGIYEKMGKKLEMAKAHRMAGEMFMLLSDFEKAREHIQIYLKTSKSLHNKVEEQRAYATLGRAHLLHGQSTSESSAAITLEQLKQAEKAFLKSLLLIKEITGLITKLEQSDMQARCYLNIGVVKEHMEEFEESIAYIERAIKICKSHDLFELTHLCYISMSLLYHCKKNDATLALRYCNLALEIAKRLPNKVQKICETLITKAEILIKAGDFASAKQILTKAYKKNSPNVNDQNTIIKMLRVVVKICQLLDELVTTSSVDYAKCKTIYEKLGDGCCFLQNYAKGIEYYKKMLECAERNGDEGKNLAPIYVSLYQTFKDNQQYDKALEYLWKEYEINKDEPTEAFSTLCGIADICELQNQSFWTIQDTYQKARAHVEKIERPEVRRKLEKVVLVRLKKLQEKHKMKTMAKLLDEDAAKLGIDLNAVEEDDSDTESESIEQNTPELAADVCLDELTDSDTSDLDETDKQRPHRVTRGTRTLAIKRNNKGETQLHQACIAGNVELVRRLLDQGHVVNVRDHAGWLPLHEAANHGYRDIVELLLDRGAAVAINDKGGTSCDGITPLYDACANGYLDVVELLLDRGADATVKTDFGDTCVKGLDTWRRSKKLTTGEQAHYHQVRTTLVRPLAKVGLVGNSATPAESLTNTQTETLSCDEEQATSSNDDEENYNFEGSAFRHESSRNSKFRRNSKILHDSNKSSKDSSARFEYRTVMEQVKHPNRMFDDDPYGSAAGSGSSALNNSLKQKRNALLNSEEVDDDTWLVDDVGPEKKKRRFITPTREIPRSSHNTSAERLSTSKESLYDAPFTGNFDATAVEFGMEMNDSSSGENGLSQQRSKLSLTKPRNGRSSSIGSTASLSLSKKRASKQQSSLLDSGFCRFRSESPNMCEDDAIAPTAISLNTEPDSTTATAIHLHITSPGKNPSPIQLHTSQILATTISFKIKVETELLLVPIERRKLNDINIRWLAEEAARRYYNLTGLKPLLRLKTADGFAFEENDPVSVAVEQNMILATVLEWRTAPLGQRYEEMCHKFNKVIDVEVQRRLEHAQSSNSVLLENFWLTPQHTEPLFRAIMHQSQLRVLDLSNNFMQNEGAQQLAKAVGTLKQLKVLNLRGNFITSAGLQALLQGVDCVQQLDELEELDISQNPLGNECLRILHKFCNPTGLGPRQSLRKMFLSQCEITNFYDYELCYNQLVALDVSFNTLHCDERRKVLSKLNSCRMECINLSYSYTEPDYDDGIISTEPIVQFFESGTCEQFKKVALCGCGLSDAHISRIVQSLSKANSLELLDITDNKRLTASSLQYIIEEIPQLRKFVATNCNRLFDAERIEKLHQLKQLPNLLCLTLDEKSDGNNDAKQQLCTLWRSHWKEKANIVDFERNLVLYTNAKDVI